MVKLSASLLVRGLGTISSPLAIKSTGVRLLTDNSAGLTGFETYLGTTAGHIIAFCEINNAGASGGSCSWAQCLTATNDIIANLVPLGRRIHWAVPGCTATAGEGYAEVMAGAHDATINAMFTAIAAADTNDRIWTRPMWEMNLWAAYPWARAFLTPGQYIKLWRKIVAMARAISARFAFDWTINWSVKGADGAIVDPMPYYPGDAWVDVLGMDAYIQYAEHVTLAGRTPGAAVNYMFRSPFGLDWLVAEADRRGKPWMIPEWGIRGDGTGANGTTGDSLSAFVNRIYALVKEGNCLGHGYWDKATPINCQISNAQYPVAAAAYKDAFDKVSRPWTPKRYLGAGLVDHYDTSIFASMTIAGGTCSAIVSQVGTGRSLVHATSANQPAYSATARNGLPGLTFDGTDDNLVQTTVTGTPATNEEASVFAEVYHPAGMTGFRYFWSDADAGTNQRAIGSNATNLRIQGSTGLAPGVSVSAVDLSIAATFSGPYDATNQETVQVSTNGGVQSTDSALLTVVPAAATRRILGAGPAGSNGITNFSAVTFQEGFEANYKVSRAGVDAAGAYLAWKWSRQASLPANHPDKLAAPTYGGF